jgi:hypothetical protein
MMKNVIRKILKEEFNPDDLKSPDINISPDTELRVARSKYGWGTYIPEIGRRIYFSINPEPWNLKVGIGDTPIEGRGHGSFGDDSHPDFQEYWITTDENDYRDDYYKPKTKKLKQTSEEEGDYELYDIKDGIESIKKYSEEAEQVTKEFKKNVQKLFADYKQKINTIITNSDFAAGDHRRVKLVDVDNEGNFKTEDDFGETQDGWWDQSDMFRDELENKKHREL